MKNHYLSSIAPITQAFLERDCLSYYDAAIYVRELSYGRNTGDGLLRVLKEGRGTCSSKHLLLAQLAEENNWLHIKIVVGIYMMNEENTPGVGAVLKKYGLSEIPEAHCYLNVYGTRYDFTRNGAREILPEDFSVEEYIVHLEALLKEKPKLHKAFLAEWGQERSEDEIWKIREECIAALQE